MVIDWKKISLILSILLLAAFAWRYYMSLHTLDLAWNFWRVAECDYVTTEKCVEFKDLWIMNFNRLELLFIGIVALSIFIGYIIQDIRWKTG